MSAEGVGTGGAAAAGAGGDPSGPTPDQRREMYRLMSLILAVDERVRRGLSGG